MSEYFFPTFFSDFSTTAMLPTFFFLYSPLLIIWWFLNYFIVLHKRRYYHNSDGADSVCCYCYCCCTHRNQFSWIFDAPSASALPELRLVFVRRWVYIRITSRILFRSFKLSTEIRPHHCYRDDPFRDDYFSRRHGSAPDQPLLRHPQRQSRTLVIISTSIPFTLFFILELQITTIIRSARVVTILYTFRLLLLYIAIVKINRISQGHILYVQH